ncbi:MAG: biopolymer transporter ExbD [Proteobacteria bacterium]|nr:biopolymer transporter ExbD [Pseudomonadota bacterium]MBS0460900.1 biopolymer transporter ExbD [Pseudomonadota bacterium]
MNLGSNRQTIDEPEINLISLVDVVFCLIIFLVVTTSFNRHSGLKLQLPQADAAATAQKVATVSVTIDAEGHYYVGKEAVAQRDVASLRAAIQRVAGNRRDLPVVLTADARTQHQAVVTAMEALGELGFQRLSIATAPEPHR